MLQKRLIAVVLTVAMVLGTATTALAANNKKTVDLSVTDSGKSMSVVITVRDQKGQIVSGENIFLTIEQPDGTVKALNMKSAYYLVHGFTYASNLKPNPNKSWTITAKLPDGSFDTVTLGGESKGNGPKEDKVKEQKAKEEKVVKKYFKKS
jgi:hypothetical protein